MEVRGVGVKLLSQPILNILKTSKDIGLTFLTFNLFFLGTFLSILVA